MAAMGKSAKIARDPTPAGGEGHAVLIGLSAAVVSVAEERPRALIVHRADAADALPFGTFDPLAHRTLESGLRSWVEEQTRLQLGYVEQLYTFGDRGRHLTEPGEGPRVLSVGYLALTRPQEGRGPETQWRDWYGYFPWEDWREKKPSIIEALIVPRLTLFVASAPNAELRERRRDLATAMGRLRAKMKYRPVVFELMPPEFTLLELQRTVEALSGIRLHKQNFRRLVEAQGLVEGTGRLSRKSAGRPAEQFRFRREVVRERPAPGVRLSPNRPPR